MKTDSLCVPRTRREQLTTVCMNTVYVYATDLPHRPPQANCQQLGSCRPCLPPAQQALPLSSSRTTTNARLAPRCDVERLLSRLRCCLTVCPQTFSAKLPVLLTS